MTITCKNNKGIMQYVTDLRLKSKGKFTLASDCSAVGSSFTLLSRDVRRNEDFAHPEYSLIIPIKNQYFLKLYRIRDFKTILKIFC